MYAVAKLFVSPCFENDPFNDLFEGCIHWPEADMTKMTFITCCASVFNILAHLHCEILFFSLADSGTFALLISSDTLYRVRNHLL